MVAAAVMQGRFYGFLVACMMGNKLPMPSNMKKAKPIMLQYESSFMGTRSGPGPSSLICASAN